MFFLAYSDFSFLHYLDTMNFIEEKRRFANNLTFVVKCKLYLVYRWPLYKIDWYKTNMIKVVWYDFYLIAAIYSQHHLSHQKQHISYWDICWLQYLHLQIQKTHTIVVYNTLNVRRQIVDLSCNFEAYATNHRNGIFYFIELLNATKQLTAIIL